MPPRSSRYLALLAATVVLASAYLTFVVTAGEDDGSPLVFPDAAGPVLSESPPPRPVRADLVPSLAIDIELSPRARLMVPVAPVPPPCVLIDGDRTIDAAPSIVAGPGAGTASGNGRHLVRFDLPGGEAVCRVVYLRDDEPIEVEAGGVVRFRGRVTAGETPVAGAEVWGGEIGASGQWVTTATDADGSFELPVRGGSGIPVVIVADGFASSYRVVDFSGFQARPLEIRLDRAGDVTVALAARLAAPSRGVAYVVPEAGATALPSRHYPFFLQAFDGGWPLDESGRTHIEDLPLGVAFDIVIRHPLAPSATVESTGRVELSTTVIAGAADSNLLRGRVVDADGEPLAAVVTASGRHRRRLSRGALLPAAAQELGVSRVATDADGYFQLADDGTGTIRAAAAGHCSLEARVQAGSDTPTLVLPRLPESPGSPSLRFVRADGRDAVVRLRERGRSWTTALWIGGEPFERPLTEPVLTDVEVRVENRTIRMSSIAVVGPTVVAIDG